MGWVRGRAVVAAVLVVLALLVAGCAEAKRDTAARGPTPSGAPPPRIPSAPDLPGFAADVGFASDGSGFALLGSCGNSVCRHHVAVLDKGAGAWRLGRSPVPDTTDGSGVTAGLIALGPGRALITDGKWPPPERTWFTDNGGRSWRHGSTGPSGSTSVVPEGGALVEDCVRVDRERNGCERSRLLAALPDTGEFRVLATPPPLEGEVRPAGEIPGETAGKSPDKVLFAAGRAPDSGFPALAVSEDRGRSWRISRPEGLARHGWSLHVTGTGKVLYAVQPGQLPDEDDVKNGLLTLHRSTDGGRTWERVWKHRKGVEPRSTLGTPVVAADGSLTIHGEAGAWRSIDGGRSFLPASDTRGLAGSVTVTPLGHLWGSSFNSWSWRISADGVHWRPFELGDGT